MFYDGWNNAWASESKDKIKHMSFSPYMQRLSSTIERLMDQDNENKISNKVLVKEVLKTLFPHLSLKGWKLTKYLTSEQKQNEKSTNINGQHIIKPYTRPNTGYKSKVSGKVVVESSVLDKYFGGKIKLTDHEGLAHGGHTKKLHVGLIFC